MLRITTAGTNGIRLCAALLFPVLLCVLFLTPESCLARNAKLVLFDMGPEKNFSIQKNTKPLAVVNSSGNGVVQFTDLPAAGDVYAISGDGTMPEPPSAPTGLVAQGDNLGCVLLQWQANPETDIDYYRVYYGRHSVEGGEASAYEQSVDAAAATTVTVCELSEGTWYFSVRAHNTAGLLSALSPETNASVSNGSTQPPPPPMVLGASAGDPGCVEVSWLPAGSPEVTGYVVDYGRLPVEGGTGTYEKSVDVENVSSHQVCNLTEGTWYFAVRSRNHAGVLSAYSAEHSAVVTPTPVLINSFTAEVGKSGVDLAWRVSTGEKLAGFSLRRMREGDTQEIVLNKGRLLNPKRDSWKDREIESTTAYLYHLVVVGKDGTEYRSAPVRVTSAEWAALLEQNVPNPFNPSTSISFVVPVTSRTRVIVYDVSGSQVKTLIDDVLDAGSRTVVWDGTNESGQMVGSGTYFCRLVTDGTSTTRKMLLIK
jgi:hypothetical protein